MISAMRDELIEKTKEYCEVQDQLGEIKVEITELREEMFGDDSEGTKERARELFSEVSQGGASKSERLDTLENKREELRQRRATVRDEIREKLVDVRFPLDETIETENAPPIEFPYEEAVDSHVLDAIEDLHGDELNGGFVTIGTDAITVDTDSVDKAIDAVEDKVMEIREHAEKLLDVEKHVEKVRNRDEKVAAMMYALAEEGGDEGLTKAEMEDSIGLERGDLRGVLYNVIDGTPYINKPESKAQLTTTGQELIDRYVKTYGIPSLFEAKSGEDSGTENVADDENGEGQEEVTAFE